MDVHRSALKHGVPASEIEHAVGNAMVIEDLEDDLRLYLGPTQSATLLEVVALVRDDGSEMVIHAMQMRERYRRLLPGGEHDN